MYSFGFKKYFLFLSTQDHRTPLPAINNLSKTRASFHLAPIYWPGATSWPLALVSCAQPPARGSPPDFCAKSCMRFSSSGLKCRMRPWMGHAKASPRARRVKGQLLAKWIRQGIENFGYIPQIVWPSTCLVSSWIMSISRRRPWPFSNLLMICSVHLLPSRQGVHWPHDSWR